MDKLTMAQRFAEIFASKIERPNLIQSDDTMKIIAINANKLADAMKAEADKRNTTQIDDCLQAERDAELYGNGFLKVSYNKDGVNYERLDPKLTTLNICTKQEEWQPDWSQAPDKALTWAIDSDGYASWVLYEDGHYFCTVVAPSFDYKGNWKNSLRKRPSNL